MDSFLEHSLIPIFPLGQVVLFPKSLMPLHIFEPRYRKMVKDSVAAHNRFVIVNVDAQGRQASVGCVAEILHVQSLPDGRSNILTLGAERVRVRELDTTEPYLRARVDSYRDVVSAGDEVACTNLCQQLSELNSILSKVSSQSMPILSPDDQDFEQFSFLVGEMLAIGIEDRQTILEMQNTKERVLFLMKKLDAATKQVAALSAIEEAFSGK